MVVVLETPDGEVPTEAGFGFHEQRERPLGSTPFPVRNVVAEDGRFVLEDLLPGRFRMHVRPGREWGGRPGDWAEVVIDVEVPVTGQVDRIVEIIRGGRLQLDVVDTEGRPLEAGCTLHAPDGQAVSAWFRCEDVLGNVVMSQNTLPGLGPCEVEPVLTPGAYRIRIALDGYAPEERQVLIEAGKPTSVRVTLRR